MSNQEGEVIGREAACCAGLSAPLDEAEAAEPAKAFRALGAPVRLRLMSMIASRGEDGELCACAPTPAFELSRPTISHHLKSLRQAGLIDRERRGTWVYHWVQPGVLDRLAAFPTTPRATGAGA
ncbi:ArsR/SmtB family transcription factor [Streptomyces tropicalis]|uniref:Metalloregulator ArsR/SmtB family transcription factor n=1 Tax=Streptomyces tropicalis TaxID=3034234 RepID=A0ABT6AC56_9ACTN|nr:metalloregulator ArsR/SmtB family transcription factor [Streptomyces tropicalis]MDF3302236.1 metalloregulator ArsR/SmtB family transcription factor [Streptomyces tropicalis]